MQFVILRLLFNPSLQGLFQKLIPRKGLMGQLNSSAGSILTEIEKSTILNNFFRIEIEKQSIFLNSLRSYKIEIEL